MASNDLLKRLIDTGMSFTQMTQARAETLVKELVNLGEVSVEEATATVSKLVERGRESSEHLVDLVRAEVTRQLQAFGVVGKETPVDTPSPAPAAPAPAAAEPAAAPAAEPAPAKKAPAAKKAAAAKKAPAKKAPAATKAPAKKVAAKDATTTPAVRTQRPSARLGR